MQVINKTPPDHVRLSSFKEQQTNRPINQFWQNIELHHAQSPYACMAGQKRVSQTHIVSEALSNEHAKKREGKETKRWISSRSVHSTHSSVVINRSILIYMAWSQFAVLNMLVLYFSPKHVKWETFLNTFLCNLLTRKLSNVFKVFENSAF